MRENVQFSNQSRDKNQIARRNTLTMLMNYSIEHSRIGCGCIHKLDKERYIKCASRFNS